MTWISLVLIALTTARITRLITKDFLLDRPRDALLRRLDVGAHTQLQYLLVCPWCMSVYVGAGVAGAWWAWGETMGLTWTMAFLSASHVTGFLATKGGTD